MESTEKEDMKTSPHQEWRLHNGEVEVPEWFVRYTERVRDEENEAWLAGDRCDTCGGEKEQDHLTDTCLKCLEDE